MKKSNSKNPITDYSATELMALRAFAKEELGKAEDFLHSLNEKTAEEIENDEELQKDAKKALERGMYFSLMLDRTTNVLSDHCTNFFPIDEANAKAKDTMAKAFATAIPKPTSPADVN